MPKCDHVCPPPSAAKTGPCLLEKGHRGPHETYGISVAILGGGKAQTIQDGSEHFKWTDRDEKYAKKMSESKCPGY